MNRLRHAYESAFLISLYGAPLAQRASYLALHSSLFGPVANLAHAQKLIKNSAMSAISDL